VALLVLVVPFIRDLLVTWRRMLALAELRDNKTNRDEYLFLLRTVTFALRLSACKMEESGSERGEPCAIQLT